jgi:nucleotide-binding universal stress UspA family protein
MVENLFNNILVPVDLSAATPSTVEKAVEIAKEYDCSLHLLHVSPVDWLPMTRMSADGVIEEIDRPDRRELVSQMIGLIDYAEELSDGAIKIDYRLQKGKWDQQVIDIVNYNGIDLVLVGQNEKADARRTMPLNPNKIAALTDVPVITLPYGRRFTRLHSILIPVTDFLPIRKLVYGAYIASRNRASLRLLGVAADKGKDRTQHFLKKSYQLVQESTPVYVDMAVTSAHNVAKAIRDLAKEEGTDLVVVNPIKQTKLAGLLFSSPIETIQEYNSSPVLSVNPI